MTFAFGQTLTVIRPATPVKFGDPGGAPTSTDVPGCVIWPGDTTETTVQQDQVVADFTALFPPGTDILATDQVGYSGGVCQVIGRPQVYSSPFTGLNPGIVVRLSQVSG